MKAPKPPPTITTRGDLASHVAARGRRPNRQVVSPRPEHPVVALACGALGERTRRGPPRSRPLHCELEDDEPRPMSLERLRPASARQIPPPWWQWGGAACTAQSFDPLPRSRPPGRLALIPPEPNGADEVAPDPPPRAAGTPTGHTTGLRPSTQPGRVGSLPEHEVRYGMVRTWRMLNRKTQGRGRSPNLPGAPSRRQRLDRRPALLASCSRPATRPSLWPFTPRQVQLSRVNGGEQSPDDSDEEVEEERVIDTYQYWSLRAVTLKSPGQRARHFEHVDRGSELLPENCSPGRDHSTPHSSP
jgi:hypothetical protein